jgi:hypothetical protein
MTGELSTFIPGAGVKNPRWTGRRKQIQRCTSGVSPMGWGKTAKEREESFADWHHCAIQIVHLAGVSFRLLAFVKQNLDMGTGLISGTNIELAKMGGGCSVSTIQREIGHYENLGLFIGTRRRHRKESGDIIEVRTLRLSLPKVFAPGITMREDEP